VGEGGAETGQRSDYGDCALEEGEGKKKGQKNQSSRHLQLRKSIRVKVLFFARLVKQISLAIAPAFG
jgi:hypothetical protein